MIACAAAGAATLAFTQAGKDPHTAPAKGAPGTAPHTPPGPALPPGWTEADMQACMDAGTPGPNQAFLCKQAGAWHGKTTMWMAPDAQPETSECMNTITPIMDGRYIQCSYAGEMPGMGPFHGLGITGYDNVSGSFVGTWLDSHSTGIMTGVGRLSEDKRTMTWAYTFNCPITKKPATMRQIETYASPTSMTLDMFMTDPKTGREYKLMHIDFTKKG
jgi:hypothetical protein